MVSAEDKTTITVSKDTREWLNLLKLDLKQPRSGSSHRMM
jgi:hypothetical protein